MDLPRKIQESSLIIRKEVFKSRFQRRQELKDKRIKVLPYQRVYKSKGGKTILKGDGDRVIKNDHYGNKFL